MINDYGQFSIMPVTGKPEFEEDKRASWFSHKAEIAKPYYYKVYLAEHDVVTEMVPTERAVMFRFTFPENDSYVVVDAFDRGSSIKVIPGENKIVAIPLATVVVFLPTSRIISLLSLISRLLMRLRSLTMYSLKNRTAVFL